MLKIKVDGRYKSSILLGKKTSTIREGARNHRIGEKAELWTEKGMFANAVITGIEFKQAGELTEEDARRDGFKSKKELLKALEKHYGWLQGKEFTIVRFKRKDKMDARRIAEQALESLDLGTSERVLCRAVLEYGSMTKAAKELGKGDIEPHLKRIFQELKERLSEQAS